MSTDNKQQLTPNEPPIVKVPLLDKIANWLQLLTTALAVWKQHK